MTIIFLHGGQTWYLYYGRGTEPMVYLSVWGLVVCMFVLGLAIGVVLAVGMLLYFQVTPTHLLLSQSALYIFIKICLTPQ